MGAKKWNTVGVWYKSYKICDHNDSKYKESLDQ